MQMERCLTVIIPVYNEEKSVTEILDAVLSRPETAEIIVVDDASADRSREIVDRYVEEKGGGRIKLLCQEKNRGKGAAIRRGFDEAGADIVIIQDADREYSPADYPIILKPFFADGAHVVYGSRFQGGPGKVVQFRHMMGNKLLTLLSNWLSGLALTDMETCYKAFRREVIQNLLLSTNRFGIEVEMTAKIAKARKLQIYEVPIHYQGRGYDEGKKITWRDGVAALWYMIKFNLLTGMKRSFKRPWSEVLREDIL